MDASKETGCGGNLEDSLINNNTRVSIGPRDTKSMFNVGLEEPCLDQGQQNSAVRELVANIGNINSFVVMTDF